MSKKEKSSALDALKAAREGKQKRSKQHRVSQLDDVFDQVEDDEATRLAQQRQDRSFVVHDDTDRNPTQTAEDWDDYDNDYDEGPASKKKKRGGGGGGGGAKKKAAVVSSSGGGAEGNPVSAPRITSLFRSGSGAGTSGLGGGASSAGHSVQPASLHQRQQAPVAATDDFLESALSDLAASTAKPASHSGSKKSHKKKSAKKGTKKLAAVSKTKIKKKEAAPAVASPANSGANAAAAAAADDAGNKSDVDKGDDDDDDDDDDAPMGSDDDDSLFIEVEVAVAEGDDEQTIAARAAAEAAKVASVKGTVPYSKNSGSVQSLKEHQGRDEQSGPDKQQTQQPRPQEPSSKKRKAKAAASEPAPELQWWSETNESAGGDDDVMGELAQRQRQQQYESVNALQAATDGKSTPFMLFFWTDAAEDTRNAPGTVYLFGKTTREQAMRAGALPVDQQPKGRQPAQASSLISVCVVVRNIERTLFFAPRSGADPLAMYKEVEKLRRSQGIRSMRAKRVEREYHFDVPGVPHGPSTYLKMQYAASEPQWTTMSGQTFCHVFGTNTSALESFIIRRKIMGPCWLRLALDQTAVSAPPTRERLSHCRGELWCSNMRLVVPLTDSLLQNELAAGHPDQQAAAADAPDTAQRQPAPKPPHPQQLAKVPPPPLLTVMSLIVRTIYNHSSQANEIVAVAAVVHQHAHGDRPTERPEQGYFSFCAVRRLAGHPLPPEFRGLLAKEKQQQRRGPIEVCGSERALLSFVLAKLELLDPDVIVGHNFVGFTLDVILHRMKAHSIVPWSKLGRLRRRRIPKLQAGAGGTSDSTYGEKQVMAGRLVLDTYTTTKELLPRVKSYGLQDLTAQVLKARREDLDFDQTANFFTSGQSLVQFVRHAEMDAFFCLQLQFALQVLPLTMQLTNLAGNLWSRSLMGARAERIEYLLLHEFHRRKHITPDREWPGSGGANAKKKKGAPRRDKPKYSGGLVLEPKAGFYDDYVLLLDFNSLYPSIIQEHNICFTTVSRARDHHVDSEADAEGEAGAGDGPEPAVAIPLPVIPDPQSPGDEPVEVVVGRELAERSRQSSLPWLPAEPPSTDMARGVLPRVINTLVERRRAVKKLMKAEHDPAKRELLNIRQLSLKLIANSMYGCLGFAHSRFCAQPLAELITRKGRETLQMTVDLATSKHNLDVVYGDTDSIMIRTKVPSAPSASLLTGPDAGSPDAALAVQRQQLASVLELGKTLKSSVNQRFKLLEIEIDGVFASLLLLKKKKYAALALLPPYTDPRRTERETKGLDLVRRDWCDLSRATGEKALDEILAGKSSDDVVAAIHGHLKVCGERVRAGQVPLDDFVITKSLSKLPQDYPDAKHQPHVQVALKLQKMGRRVGVGDRIPYVICTGPASMSVADRACHPDLLTKQEQQQKNDADMLAAVNAAATGGDSAAAVAGVKGEDQPAPSDAQAQDGQSDQQQPSSQQPQQQQQQQQQQQHQQVNDSQQLSIDIDWYLTQQILPPITRLCDAIPGTSVPQLANALGVDSTKYRNTRGGGGSGGSNGEDDDEDEASRRLAALTSVDPKQKFRTADPLMTACWHCGNVFAFQGIRDNKKEAGDDVRDSPVANGAGAGADHLIGNPMSGLYCPSCAEPINCLALANSLTQAIRSCQSRFYDGWLVCTEKTCGRRTRQLTWRQRADEPGRACCVLPFCDGRVRVEYDQARLMNQLEYYRWCFDVLSEQKLRAEVAPDQHATFIKQVRRVDEDGVSDADMFFSLRTIVDRALQRNARYTVNTKSLFSACV